MMNCISFDCGWTGKHNTICKRGKVRKCYKNCGEHKVQIDDCVNFKIDNILHIDKWYICKMIFSVVAVRIAVLDLIFNSSNFYYDSKFLALFADVQTLLWCAKIWANFVRCANLHEIGANWVCEFAHWCAKKKTVDFC